MRRSVEPRFPWRGVVLIAIGFALIGLAVLLRSGGVPSSTVTASRSIPASTHLGHVLKILGVGPLFVVAAGLGVCCAYIHLAYRFREQLKREREPESHNKT